MGRKRKYDITHIHEVKRLMNEEGFTKREAIDKVGFSDPTLFYSTLKRYGLKQIIDFVPINECIF